MAPSTSKVRLKLLIDKENRRVLFAEAGKNFVDFLFTLLSLPMGTIIRLFSETDVAGSFAKLYKSLEDLDDDYVLPNKKKDWLLKPKSSSFSVSVALLPNDKAPTVPPMVARTLYKCSRSGCNPDIQTSYDCRTCHYRCSEVIHYVPDTPMLAVPTAAAPASDAGADEGGFVKGMMTYMVMDDLEVKRMSTISSIALLNKYNIKEMDELQEKVVEIGMAEGLSLLKNALSSKTVLINVFLGGNQAC